MSDTETTPKARKEGAEFRPLIKDFFEQYPLPAKAVEEVAAQVDYTYATIRSGMRGNIALQRTTFDVLVRAAHRLYPGIDPGEVAAARTQTSTRMRHSSKEVRSFLAKSAVEAERAAFETRVKKEGVVVIEGYKAAENEGPEAQARRRLAARNAPMAPPIGSPGWDENGNLIPAPDVSTTLSRGYPGWNGVPRREVLAPPPDPDFNETHTAGILRLAIDRAARFLSDVEIRRLIQQLHSKLS